MSDDNNSLISPTTQTTTTTPEATSSSPIAEEEKAETSSKSNENPSANTNANAASSLSTSSSASTSAASASASTSASSKPSKKRHRETGTPAALTASLSKIYDEFPTHILPTLHIMIDSYKKSKANNVPQLISQNIRHQIQNNVSKNLNESPAYVHLSKTDAAPQLNIDAEKMTVKGGMRGYRMVRASEGVKEGCWFYEAVVLDPPSVEEVVNKLPSNVRLGDGVREGLKRGLEEELEMKQKQQEEAKNASGAGGGLDEGQGKKKKRKVDSNGLGVKQYAVGGHLRMGWSMRTGELQAPVGYDKWSYGIRDIHGSRIHNSKREDRWGGVGFRPGDVIGFAICFADKDDIHDDYGSKRSHVAVKSNHIRFFKNGAPMGHFVVSRGVKSGGEAFDNIDNGTYYPAISSYMGGTARVNFGPHFIYPPKGLPTGMKLRPISELCKQPMEPSEVLETFKKNKLFKKGVDEEIVEAIHSAVSLEATMRYDAFQKYVDDQVAMVRKARNDRGAGTSDLPDPIDTPAAAEDDVVMEGSNGA